MESIHQPRGYYVTTIVTNCFPKTIKNISASNIWNNPVNLTKGVNWIAW